MQKEGITTLTDADCDLPLALGGLEKGTTPVEIFRQVLEHEEYVTSRINALADVADEVKDRAALIFLNWYIKEQVEEEASVGGVLAKLELIGDDKQGIFALDKELSTRVFNPPVIG